jgi:hypothetical protein
MLPEEKYMTVRNLGGATQIKCNSSSWLAHWEIFSGQNAVMCFAEGCINRPSFGGQVQKDSPTDKNWYVIPLCNDCNNKRGQDLDIWDTANLAPANVIETFAPWATERFPEGRLFR